MLNELNCRINRFFEPGNAITLGNWEFRLTAKTNQVETKPEFIGCLEYTIGLEQMTDQDYENYNMMRALLEVTFDKLNVYQVDQSYFQHGKARIYVFYDEEAIWRKVSFDLQ